MNSRTTAKKIERSKSVVNNLLNLNDNYCKKNSGGRPKSQTSTEEQTVLRLASTEKYSKMEIIKQTDLNICRKVFATLLNELVICNIQQNL